MTVTVYRCDDKRKRVTSIIQVYYTKFICYQAFLINIFGFPIEQFYVGCFPRKFSVEFSDFGNKEKQLDNTRIFHINLNVWFQINNAKNHKID